MDEKTFALLEKVSALYNKYGIRSVTMDDLATQLGISKKTLYEHFEDKNDLVKQTLTHQMRKTDCEFKEMALHKQNAIETLLSISDIIARNMSEMNPSLTFDLMKYYPDCWELLLEFKRERVFNSVKANLVSGIKEGLYRKDFDPDVIAHLYVSRMRGGMDTESFPNIQQNFSAFFKELITYHIRGIASTKGLEVFEKISKNHKLFQ